MTGPSDPAPSAAGSGGAGSVPGRSPQGAERTVSDAAGSGGAGSVPGRSPQGAERTAAALSDP
ncbi:hypothetical protein ACFC4A_37995, partial [Streptomyces virginiae]